MATKTIPVRLDIETHKEFSKRLIDDGISAQEFFRQKVDEYLQDKARLTVIFDNGGGITLQFGEWAHHYGGYKGYAEQAAQDYINYLDEGSAAGWEGHEDDASDLVPTYDDMRNGGYRVFRGDEIEKTIAGEDDYGWNNISGFCEAIREIRAKSK